ncbi:MAG TPA: double-strand break repair protein AddB [Amaricoccus sp.]|nr:double-strand break repair protein AddB [Amaricoccus sp.]
MTLFPASEGPRVFGLPPGVDFAAALVAGLDARLAGQPPEAVARVEIWVNTRRAQRALAAAFAATGPRLLPRIRVVADLADDPLAGGPQPVPPLRRKLELARLIARMARAAGEPASETAAWDLADSLAELIDEMQGEAVPLDAFAGIDAGEHAEHWQRSLRFLTLIADYAAAAGPIGGQGRMRAAAGALATRWAAAPAAHPVIVAGSTGSRAPTRALMAAVARLPQGAIVLPGFDALLPPAAWDRLADGEPGAADHPQHGFRRLATALGFDLGRVGAWHPAPAPAAARSALVSLALRPAPITDQWRAEGGALAPRLAAAADGLTWIEAPDEKREALAIALLLREAAETGTRAALVTPDRTLARRVTAELDRWGVIPDDSAGRPLALTPPGVLLRLVARIGGTPLTPEALLALLKHPLVAGAPGARGPHLRLVSRFEREKLRGGPPWVRWDELGAFAAAEGDPAPAWLAWLRAALEPLAPAGRGPLAEHVARHRATAEALAGGPGGGAHTLWLKAAGEAALALVEALAAEADAGGLVSPQEYRALLQSLIAARDVPGEAVVTHPGVAIWGTLEARVQAADRVILGGLNEGVWPRLPGADPWLDRGLRRSLGLPSPETQVGLSAHDFQQAAGAREVVFTRATRDAEAPTVASRWLLRIENLLAGLPPDGPAALAAARARGDAWVALAGRIATPTDRVPAARRPAPRPPAAARPARLSVSDLDRLVRDPYAVYAARVLRLRRLDPPGRAADALTRGTAIHAALDDFVTSTAAGLGADAEALFRAAVRDAFDREAPWPAVNAIWTARLMRTARWFLDGEARRRADAAPAARERRGRRALEGVGVTVTAVADRIDRTPDGYAIYDYKSGSTPSRGEARASYLQLPIEAAIAAAGGFDGLDAGPVARLEVIRFGGEPEVIGLDASPAAVAATWARLAALVGHYLDPATGFVARLRPGRLPFPGDYEHLSRLGEWADGDAPDEGWA